MTDHPLDTLARSLVADPPRPVDADELAAADADELAAALRRAVADLPPGEQRVRLAAAFSAMASGAADAVDEADLEAELASVTHPPAGSFTPADTPRISTATAGLLALRPFTSVKAGVLAGLAVVALLVGVLAGAATDDDASEFAVVPGAAVDPIGVLQPVAFGDEPPTDEQVAAMLPPDPGEQLAAAEAAASESPDEFAEADLELADAVYTPDPDDVDPYVSGYVDGSGGNTDLPEQGDLVDPDDPPTGDAIWPADDDSPEGVDDDGPVGLVDICAAEAVPDDCDGVGGTVVLAIDGEVDWDSDTEAEAEAVDPNRRDGRPDVRVRAISASELDVIVPVGEDERADVTMVVRSPESGADCSGPAVVEGTPRTVARAPDAITLNPGFHDRAFTVIAPEPGPFSICVRWTDSFTPPTEIERASIAVEIPTLTGTRFVMARYDQNGCLGAGCPSSPLMVRGVVEVVDGPTCNGRLDEGAMVPAAPIEMCAMEGRPGRVRLHTYAGFSRDGSYIRLDGVQSTFSLAFDPTCEESSCTTWYSVPVRAPGGLFDGNGATVGRTLFGITIDGGSAGVVIGDEIPDDVEDAEVDGPRLDWSALNVRPDPADPARSVIVDWTADRPVSVTAEATEAYTTSGCPRREAGSGAPAASGTIRLTDLCPGTNHFVGFVLVAEDGATTVYNVLRGPAIAADYVPRSAPVETETLSIVYDYELTFREKAVPTGETVTGVGVIPSRLYLELPGGHAAVDYRQWYYGNAYFALDCADPGHFNQSGSNVTANVAGSTFRPGEAEFTFHTYRPDMVGVFDTHAAGSRVCPSFYNQANRTPTRPSLTCSASIRNLAPSRISPSGIATSDRLDHLLSGGEATFVGTVRSNCANRNASTDFEVTLTVRARSA